MEPVISQPSLRSQMLLVYPELRLQEVLLIKEQQGSTRNFLI